MDDAIILKASYLRCDACPYVSPPMARELTVADVGTICPDCGADMLTMSDFVHFTAMVAANAAINKAARLLNLDTSGERVAIRTHVHDGEVTVTKLDA